MPDEKKEYCFVAFWNGKQMSIMAPTPYAASQIAIAAWKVPKSKQHMVHSHRADITHIAVD